ncbi:MAG: GTP cyclohydrolase I, partial [Thermoanaerobaculia bacterium]|nr:GTP cyclohydrolase I [Thermoanaerobaculia bacterium]
MSSNPESPEPAHLALHGAPEPSDPRIDRISAHVREILRILGLSPETDPNLLDTARRVAKMYLEIFAGLDEGKRPKLTT